MNCKYFDSYTSGNIYIFSKNKIILQIQGIINLSWGPIVSKENQHVEVLVYEFTPNILHSNKEQFKYEKTLRVSYIGSVISLFNFLE